MIKIGDKVKIIGNDNINHGFEIGSTGIIQSIDEDFDYVVSQNTCNQIIGKEDLELIEIKNNKPKQYKKGIDTMCRAESNMTLKERLGAVKWNIDKYNWRDKGQDREDFIKIKAYCDYAIKQLDNERK